MGSWMTVVVVKVNVRTQLARELSRPRWRNTWRVSESARRAAAAARVAVVANHHVLLSQYEYTSPGGRRGITDSRAEVSTSWILCS